MTLTPMETLSGIDFVRALASGTIPRPALLALMPFTLLEPQEGQVTLEATPDPRLTNITNTIHGGWIMTMLDTAMALAARTTMAAGEVGPSHETAVKFLRPVLLETGPMRIHATVLSKGRTLVAVTGQIEDLTGRIHAHGTSTCVIVKAR